MSGLDASSRSRRGAFVAFAAEHAELRFLVTEVGCGIAGYRPRRSPFLRGRAQKRGFCRNRSRGSSRAEPPASASELERSSVRSSRRRAVGRRRLRAHRKVQVEGVDVVCRRETRERGRCIAPGAARRRSTRPQVEGERARDHQPAVSAGGAQDGRHKPDHCSIRADPPGSASDSAHGRRRRVVVDLDGDLAVDIRGDGDARVGGCSACLRVELVGHRLPWNDVVSERYVDACSPAPRSRAVMNAVTVSRCALKSPPESGLRCRQRDRPP